MTFNQALKKLDIEDYGHAIWHRNSHGELFHIADYIWLAEACGEPDWFREWFEDNVEMAKKHWERPESIYQHIREILVEEVNKMKPPPME